MAVILSDVKEADLNRVSTNLYPSPPFVLQRKQTFEWERDLKKSVFYKTRFYNQQGLLNELDKDDFRRG